MREIQTEFAQRISAMAKEKEELEKEILKVSMIVIMTQHQVFISGLPLAVQPSPHLTLLPGPSHLSSPFSPSNLLQNFGFLNGTTVRDFTQQVQVASCPIVACSFLVLMFRF